MELFEERKVRKPATVHLGAFVSPGAVTPWGRVCTRAVFGGVDTECRELRRVRMLGSGALNFGWITNDAKVELLQVLLGDDLVRPGNGFNAMAWIWRLATWDALESLRFECRLEILTGTAEQAALVIGTENPATMSRRAAVNDGLPSRFAELDMSGVVSGTQHGVAIALPSLTRGEQCQIHFVAAWRNVSTWEGRGCLVQLDLDPKRILEAAQAY
jgi:hypothetical protein